MSRYIIGVYSGHDASACLFKDNQLLFAIEKERLSRIKHDEGEPTECIEYLLDAAAIKPSDIDLVVRCNWHNTIFRNDGYYSKFAKVIENPNHHLFHAYSVSIVRQNEDMIILVYDGHGCRPCDCGVIIPQIDNMYESESVFIMRNRYITPLEKRFSVHEKGRYSWGSFLDSLGYVYGAVSKTIFGSVHAAGKTMALASFGNDSNIPDALSNNYAVNRLFLDYLSSLETPVDWNSETAKNISYKVQKAVEQYLSGKICMLSDKYGIHNFGLTGGVALNCKNNGLLSNLDCVSNLNLFPACADDGIAIGAAVWAIREYFNDNSEIIWHYVTGRTYRKTQIDTNEINKTVELLDKGNYVGLFENGSEFGPRALCNRSIICNARSIMMKDRLNKDIKHREAFRPFGGVVLERNLTKLTDKKLSNPYMLSAITIKEEFQNKIPALLHVDNTVRLQVISDNKSLIYHILDSYEKKTGDLVLINTSYNSKGEPIVETEEEAIDCAARIGLKYIMMSGKLICL